ncbi:MAG: transposase [Nitrospinae bacterium]|nr:transposase [Nitrospinota bacterium]
MISAVSPRGEMRFVLVPGRMNATKFCTFLHRLLRRATRPIFPIVDVHPAHRARKVQQFLTRVKGRVRLFFLLPYAPELNPDEWVWADLTHQTMGRTLIATREDFSETIRPYVGRLQRNRARVRAFFQVPSVWYAAA